MRRVLLALALLSLTCAQTPPVLLLNASGVSYGGVVVAPPGTRLEACSAGLLASGAALFALSDGSSGQLSMLTVSSGGAASRTSAASLPAAVPAGVWTSSSAAAALQQRRRRWRWQAG